MTSKKLNTLVVASLLLGALMTSCTTASANGGNPFGTDGGLGADQATADAGGDASLDAATQDPNTDEDVAAAPDVPSDTDTQAPDATAVADAGASGVDIALAEDAGATGDGHGPQDAGTAPDVVATKDVAAAKDTATPDAGPVCGDGSCESGETPATCPKDCLAAKTCTTYADVQPIFLNNCNGCHGHAFGNGCTSAGNYAAINSYVQSGQMPKGGALSAAQKSTVAAWAAAKNACTTASCP